jgi:hypothetical protein
MTSRQNQIGLNSSAVTLGVLSARQKSTFAWPEGLVQFAVCAHRGPSGALRSSSALRRSSQRHHRQLLASGVKADVQRDLRAALPFHAGLRLGARRAARPFRARFQPRLAVGGLTPMVDLVGSLAAERRVWPVSIEPADVGIQGALELLPPSRHNQSRQELLLQRADQSLHQRDALSRERENFSILLANSRKVRGGFLSSGRPKGTRTP